MNRIYIAPHPDPRTDGKFIAIEHGDTDYHITDVDTQEHADTLNKLHSISRAQAKAAVMCSMFDCWQNFDKLTANK